MKRASLKFVAFAIVLCVGGVISSRAQGTFRFDLGQQVLSAWIYGGLGSLTVDASSGQFVIDVVDPYSGDSFTPLIITPSGTLGRQTPWKPSHPAMKSHVISCVLPSERYVTCGRSLMIPCRTTSYAA